MAPDVKPGGADLWCTYAAVRTHAWLDRTDALEAPDLTCDYLLSHRNSDGGYAWSRGMPSDAWATFYCTAALKDMGMSVPDPDKTLEWLWTTWSGNAFAMTPGQEPEVWATHFAVRAIIEVLDGEVPAESLLSWLAGLQTPDGGLTWSPNHEDDSADARACFYGVAVWRALNRRTPVAPPWDVPALVSWLQLRQHQDGGFTFSTGTPTPCLWATYRAVGALAMLGEEPAAPCAPWIHQMRATDGTFVRWAGYEVSDVWATFCAVGALKALGEPVEEVALPVLRRLSEIACPTGGYTYREPENAFNALTVAAALLDPDRASGSNELTGWLEACLLPNEDGIMYMPGRGAEVRCTSWALAAGAFAGADQERARIGAWLRSLQNPDGGLGFWEGRGSDLVSTAAAAEAATILSDEGRTMLDVEGLQRFVDSCGIADGALAWANTPGSSPSLRAGLQAQRVLQTCGRPSAGAAKELLDRHRVRSGGWANQGNRVPDLLSTYESVVTADRFAIAVDLEHVGAFLDRVSSGETVAWSPLAPFGEDPLARCLHQLLTARVLRSYPLPALTLS
ncbi:prenyltransferase/squalene oxidase repeat-containing protein [Promicromonospora alba]|uniref:Geranylgeranyl transferase type II subunit beta n=1 Tax=Promicromonospora alba TaxID=1616110 RepID=A0ABV9HIR6_9MICO